MSETTMSRDELSQKNPKALKNPWVLGWLALVAVVLAVNIGFISLAFITNPGLVDKDYYEKAEDYEENLVKYRNARAALGWSYQATFPNNPILNKQSLYRLSVVDKAGLPLKSANIKLVAYRPSDASADFEVTFNEIGTGIYEGNITYPLKGIWEITAVIELGDDKFDFTRRASVVTE